MGGARTHLRELVLEGPSRKPCLLPDLLTARRQRCYGTPIPGHFE